ncbi:hypothetical protein ACG7TL_006690 [Trametes sanguinea]
MSVTVPTIGPLERDYSTVGMVKSRKKSGVSRSVRRIVVKPGGGSGSAVSTSLQSTLLGQRTLVKQQEEARQRFQEALRGLGGHTRQQLKDLHLDGGSLAADEDDIYNEPSYQELQDVGQAMDVDGVPDDGEAMVHALRDIMIHPRDGYKYHDARTWRQRRERADAQWAAVLDQLVDVYLTWRYPPADEATPAAKPSHRADCTTPRPSSASDPGTEKLASDTPPVHASSSSASPTDACAGHDVVPSPPPESSAAQSPPAPMPSRLSAEPAPQAAADKPSAPRDASYDFEIDVVDIYTLARTVNIQRDAQQTAVLALAQHGYMATSPITPTLAISFKTLELFRRLRLRKASFSVEAFAKVLCDFYAFPYRRRYRTALSESFDVYLSILRAVDKRVAQALGRDAPDWRVKNSCPCCCYELENEEQLEYGRLICMDGNNSLKRIAKVGDRSIGDTREFSESDYYLPTAFIEKFRNEVKSRSTPQDRDQDEWSEISDEDLEAETAGGDPTDFAGADDMLRQCTQNWKSAARDEKKKMWGIFDETGIFASVCRHGMILWITDMVKSGELAMHPLATVGKALDVLGPRLFIGYDIGCVFVLTILASCLASEFKRQGCRCSVNAFHGYSHSHKCQTQHHPAVIKGAGLEDFETMEHIFSGSNQLAPVIRYASKYHRRLFIDLYFKQWDEDKYANLGNMILDNYRQALQIIREEGPLLEQALQSLGCTVDDLATWETEEVKYFASLGREDPRDVHAVEYVRLLCQLRDLEDRSAASMAAFVTSIPEDYSYVPPTAPASNPHYYADASRTRQLETERRLRREKRDAVLRDVIAMEVKMGIDQRWQPDMPQYIETMKYIAEREYILALENLHRLVVQRLFELQTMNISQTAYKIRTYIAKNLQKRSKAIQTAVKQYNAAARLLSPPRPALDWSKVSHYSFLEEFELLRDTRNDIRQKQWAQPLVREAMKKSRRIARAHEELRRCNVEVRRLHTAILDENTHLDAVVHKLRTEGNILSGPVMDTSIRKKRINARLLAVIKQIHELDGFTGSCLPGTRKGGAVLEHARDGPGGMEQAVERELRELQYDAQDPLPEEVELDSASRVLDFATNIV